jgi:anti-anti-sigma factor
MRQPHYVRRRLGESVWVLAVDGEHDPATRQDLRVALESMFADGRNVILDLSRATFIDSSVLSVLFYARRRRGRNVGERFAVVVPPDGAADRLFTITGATSLFSTFPTRDDATAWCADSKAVAY